MNESINTRSDNLEKPVLGTRQYMGYLNALEDKFSTYKNFNAQAWSDALNQGLVEEYLGALESTKDLPVPSDFHNPRYYSFDMQFLQMQIMAADDTEVYDATHEVWNERYNEFREEKISATEKGHLLMDLQANMAARDATIKLHLEEQVRDSINGFKKFINTVGAAFLEFGEGFIHATLSILDVVGGLDYAMGGAYEGDGFFASMLDYYAEHGLTAVSKNTIRRKLDDWERVNTLMKGLDGTPTLWGRYLGGVANSWGMMAPGMLLNMIMPGTGTWFFYTGVFANDMFENATSPHLEGTPAWTQVTNALLKSVAEAAIEVALDKVMGSTMENKLLGLGGKAIKPGAIKASARMGWKYVAKGALQEGMEEFFQDLATETVDQIYGAFLGEYKEGEPLTLQQLGDSFLVGVLSSFFMSVGGSFAGRVSNRLALSDSGLKREIAGKQAFRANPVIEINGQKVEMKGFNRLAAFDVINGVREEVRDVAKNHEKLSERVFELDKKIEKELNPEKKAKLIEKKEKWLEKEATDFAEAMLIAREFAAFYGEIGAERTLALEKAFDQMKKARENQAIVDNKLLTIDKDAVFDDLVAGQREQADTLIFNDAARKYINDNADEDILTKEGPEAYQKHLQELYDKFANNIFSKQIAGEYLTSLSETIESLIFEGKSDEHKKRYADVLASLTPEEETELKETKTTSINAIAENGEVTAVTENDRDVISALFNNTAESDSILNDKKYTFLTDGRYAIETKHATFIPKQWLKNYSNEQIRIFLDQQKVLSAIIKDPAYKELVDKIVKHNKEVTGRTDVDAKTAILDFMFNRKIAEMFLLGPEAKTSESLIFALLNIPKILKREPIPKLSKKKLTERAKILNAIERRINRVWREVTLYAITQWNVNPQTIHADHLLTESDRKFLREFTGQHKDPASQLNIDLYFEEDTTIDSKTKYVLENSVHLIDKDVYNDFVDIIRVHLAHSKSAKEIEKYARDFFIDAKVRKEILTLYRYYDNIDINRVLQDVFVAWQKAVKDLTYESKMKEVVNNVENIIDKAAENWRKVLRAQAEKLGPLSISRTLSNRFNLKPTTEFKAEAKRDIFIGHMQQNKEKLRPLSSLNSIFEKGFAENGTIYEYNSAMLYLANKLNRSLDKLNLVQELKSKGFSESVIDGILSHFENGRYFPISSLSPHLFTVADQTHIADVTTKFQNDYANWNIIVNEVDLLSLSERYKIEQDMQENGYDITNIENRADWVIEKLEQQLGENFIVTRALGEGATWQKDFTRSDALALYNDVVAPLLEWSKRRQIQILSKEDLKKLEVFTKMFPDNQQFNERFKELEQEHKDKGDAVIGLPDIDILRELEQRISTLPDYQYEAANIELDVSKKIFDNDILKPAFMNEKSLRQFLENALKNNKELFVQDLVKLEKLPQRLNYKIKVINDASMSPGYFTTSIVTSEKHNHHALITINLVGKNLGNTFLHEFNHGAHDAATTLFVATDKLSATFMAHIKKHYGDLIEAIKTDYDYEYDLQAIGKIAYLINMSEILARGGPKYGYSFGRDRNDNTVLISPEGEYLPRFDPSVYDLRMDLLSDGSEQLLFDLDSAYAKNALEEQFIQSLQAVKQGWESDLNTDTYHSMLVNNSVNILLDDLIEKSLPITVKAKLTLDEIVTNPDTYLPKTIVDKIRETRGDVNEGTAYGFLREYLEKKYGNISIDRDARSHQYILVDNNAFNDLLTKEMTTAKDLKTELNGSNRLSKIYNARLTRQMGIPDIEVRIGDNLETAAHFNSKNRQGLITINSSKITSNKELLWKINHEMRHIIQYYQNFEFIGSSRFVITDDMLADIKSHVGGIFNEETRKIAEEAGATDVDRYIAQRFVYYSFGHEQQAHGFSAVMLNTKPAHSTIVGDIATIFLPWYDAKTDKGRHQVKMNMSNSFSVYFEEDLKRFDNMAIAALSGQSDNEAKKLYESMSTYPVDIWEGYSARVTAQQYLIRKHKIEMEKAFYNNQDLSEFANTLTELRSYYIPSLHTNEIDAQAEAARAKKRAIELTQSEMTDYKLRQETLADTKKDATLTLKEIEDKLLTVTDIVSRNELMRQREKLTGEPPILGYDIEPVNRALTPLEQKLMKRIKKLTEEFMNEISTALNTTGDISFDATERAQEHAVLIRQYKAEIIEERYWRGEIPQDSAYYRFIERREKYVDATERQYELGYKISDINKTIRDYTQDMRFMDNFYAPLKEIDTTIVPEVQQLLEQQIESLSQLYALIYRKRLEIKKLDAKKDAADYSIRDAEINRLVSEANILSSKLTTDPEKSRLYTDIERVKGEIESLKKNADSISEKKAELRRAQADLAKHIKETDVQKQVTASRLKDADAYHKQLKNSLTEAEFNKYRKKEAQLDRAIDKYERGDIKLASERDALLEHISKLKIELKNMKTAGRGTAGLNIDSVIKKIKTVREQLSKKRKEFAAYKIDMTTKKNQFIELIAKLESEINKLEKDTILISKKENELSALQSKEVGRVVTTPESKKFWELTDKNILELSSLKDSEKRENKKAEILERFAVKYKYDLESEQEFHGYNIDLLIRRELLPTEMLQSYNDTTEKISKLEGEVKRFTDWINDTLDELDRLWNKTGERDLVTEATVKRARNDVKSFKLEILELQRELTTIKENIQDYAKKNEEGITKQFDELKKKWPREIKAFYKQLPELEKQWEESKFARRDRYEELRPFRISLIAELDSRIREKISAFNRFFKNVQKTKETIKAIERERKQMSDLIRMRKEHKHELLNPVNFDRLLNIPPSLTYTDLVDNYRDAYNSWEAAVLVHKNLPTASTEHRMKSLENYMNTQKELLTDWNKQLIEDYRKKLSNATFNSDKSFYARKLRQIQNIEILYEYHEVSQKLRLSPKSEELQEQFLHLYKKVIDHLLELREDSYRIRHVNKQIDDTYNGALNIIFATNIIEEFMQLHLSRLEHAEIRIRQKMMRELHKKSFYENKLDAVLKEKLTFEKKLAPKTFVEEDLAEEAMIENLKERLAKAKTDAERELIQSLLATFEELEIDDYIDLGELDLPTEITEFDRGLLTSLEEKRDKSSSEREKAHFQSQIDLILSGYKLDFLDTFGEEPIPLLNDQAMSIQMTIAALTRKRDRLTSVRNEFNKDLDKLQKRIAYRKKNPDAKKGSTLSELTATYEETKRKRNILTQNIEKIDRDIGAYKIRIEALSHLPSDKIPKKAKKQKALSIGYDEKGNRVYTYESPSYFSVEEARKSNMKYFINEQSNAVKNIATPVRNFVLATTGHENKLPTSIWNAIKTGMLNLNLLNDWLKTTRNFVSAKNKFAFDLLNEHVYQNDKITSSEELLNLATWDNIKYWYSAYKVLSQYGLPHADVLNKMSYDQFMTAMKGIKGEKWDAEITRRVKAHEFLTVKGEVILNTEEVGSNEYMRGTVMTHFDGSLASILSIANMVRDALYERRFNEERQDEAAKLERLDDTVTGKDGKETTKHELIGKWDTYEYEKKTAEEIFDEQVKSGARAGGDDPRVSYQSQSREQVIDYLVAREMSYIRQQAEEKGTPLSREAVVRGTQLLRFQYESMNESDLREAYLESYEGDPRSRKNVNDHLKKSRRIADFETVVSPRIYESMTRGEIVNLILEARSEETQKKIDAYLAKLVIEKGTAKNLDFYSWSDRAKRAARNEFSKTAYGEKVLADLHNFRTLLLNFDDDQLRKIFSKITVLQSFNTMPTDAVLLEGLKFSPAERRRNIQGRIKTKGRQLSKLLNEGKITPKDMGYVISDFEKVDGVWRMLPVWRTGKAGGHYGGVADTTFISKKEAVLKGLHKEMLALVANREVNALQMNESKKKVKKSTIEQRTKKEQSAMTVLKTYNTATRTHEDFTLLSQNQMEIPSKMIDIYNTSFSQMSDVNVQHLSRDENGQYYVKGEKGFKSILQQEKKSFTAFYELNGKLFDEMSRAEALEIVEFIEGGGAFTLTPNSHAKMANLVVFDIFTMAFIIDAARKNHNNWGFTRAEIDNMTTIAEKRASIFGSGLNAVAQIQNILNPYKTWQAAFENWDIPDTILEPIYNAIETLQRPITDEQRAERTKFIAGELKKVQTLMEEKDAADTAARKGKGWFKNWYEKVKSTRYMFLLSGPTTWVRNLTSNILVTIFNKAADVLGNFFFSKKGYREGQFDLYKTKVSQTVKDFITTNITNNPLFKELYEGSTKYEVSRKKDIPVTSDMFQNMLIDALIRKYKAEHKFDNKVMNWLQKGVIAMISDKRFIKKTAESTFAKMLQVSINNGDVTLAEGLSNKVLNLFAESLIIANETYMHKRSFMADMIDGLRKKHPVAYEVLSWWQPFLNSSFNWFAETMKYTPVGLLNGIYKMIKLEKTIEKVHEARLDKRNRTVIHSSKVVEYLTRRDIGKGIIGTLLWTTGILLGAFGAIKIDEDDDKFYIVIGDEVKVDISNVFGSSSVLAGISMGNAGELGFDQTMLHIAETLFDGFMVKEMVDRHRFDRGFYDYLLTETEGVMRSFTPQMAQLFIRSTNNQKIKYTDGMAGMWERWLNSFVPTQPLGTRVINPYSGEIETKHAIPFVGEWLKSGIVGPRIFWHHITPQEQLALDYDVRKRELTGQLTINGEIHNMPKGVLNELNMYYGKLNAASLAKLESGKYNVQTEKGNYATLHWNNMNENQRANVIKRTMEVNADIAKIYIWTQKLGNKYEGSKERTASLRKLGIITGVKVGAKGFVKQR